MMQSSDEQPSLLREAFICPHCGAYAAMNWSWLRTGNQNMPLQRAECHRCKDFSLWLAFYPDGNGPLQHLQGDDSLEGRLIYPDIYTAPAPHDDLPESCINDYKEARGIAHRSPRGAAALLRLCVQKLSIELGEPGRNINTDIASLVAKGLPPMIQQALDTVRVVGNNAVHPGEIDLNDAPSTVTALFGLVNLIIEDRITKPKEVRQLFDSLPEGPRNAVSRRDGNA